MRYDCFQFLVAALKQILLYTLVQILYYLQIKADNAFQQRVTSNILKEIVRSNLN